MRIFLAFILVLMTGCTTVPVAPSANTPQPPSSFGLWGGEPLPHTLKPGVEIITTAFLRIERGVITRMTECSVDGHKELVAATSASDVIPGEVIVHHDRESEPRDLIVEATSFACTSKVESGRHEVELTDDGQRLIWKDKEGNPSVFTRIFGE
jgi:hypothetical protein